MLIVHVDVSVVSDESSDFLAATRANAAASLGEAGVLRFDVVQDLADPAHVVLVEVYADAEAAAAHKQTAHYATWRDTVAPMMARPRSSVKYAAVHPAEASRWDTPASPPERLLPSPAVTDPVRPRDCSRAGGQGLRARLPAAGRHRFRAGPRRAGSGRGSTRCGSSAHRGSRRSTGCGRRSRRGVGRGRCGGGHRRRQRHRPGQGGRDAAGQRRRSAGLPGGDRSRARRSPFARCP